MPEATIPTGGLGCVDTLVGATNMGAYYEIDPATWTVLRQFSTPGPRPHGLACRRPRKRRTAGAAARAAGALHRARRDRHENIGKGYIGEEAFRRMLHHPLLRPLPWILEVPGLERKGPDKTNIDLLHSLAN